MILFGILGLLQSVLLPGWLLIRWLKIRGGILEKILYIFPLSLIASYLFVFLLTASGFYSRIALLVLIIVEVLLLIFSYRSVLKKPTGILFQAICGRVSDELLPVLEFLSGRKTIRENVTGGIWFLSGCGAVSAVLWAIHLCRLNIGTVFSGWDTLISWNTYARTWAEGIIPTVHGSYPQLIPANWSISYVLTGDASMQLFNTLLPPLFFLWILLMLFDLGFQKKNAGFFFSAIIARYMMKKLMGDQLFDGYMDVPAACMTFLVIYTFLKAEGREPEQRKILFFFGLTFSCGAAITKQSGLFVLFLTPVFVWFWMKDVIQGFSRKDWLICAGLILAFPIFWYAHCFLAPISDSAGDKEIVAKGIVEFNERYEFSHKLFLAREGLGVYQWVFLFSVIGLPWIDRKYRFPLFILALPIVVSWLLFYTYDMRNVAPALPVIAASSGIALNGLLNCLLSLLARLRCASIRIWIPLIIGLIFTAALFWYFFPKDKLLKTQQEGSRQLFGAQLNQELLYNILGDSHEGNDILTDYPAPFISGYQECCKSIDFSNTVDFEEKLKEPSIHYLLSPMLLQNVSWDAAMVLERCIQEERCVQIACSSGYYIPYCLYSVGK